MGGCVGRRLVRSYESKESGGHSDSVTGTKYPSHPICNDLCMSSFDTNASKQSKQTLVESVPHDVTSTMIGTSTERTHHMERPATVGGFRPSITSQVEVSKSVDEWSDLTHGLNQVICGNPAPACGNPARALSARRKKKGLVQQSELFPGELNRPSTSSGDYMRPNRGKSSITKEEIMEDRRTWGDQYEKLSLTLSETDFNDTKTELPPSLMMKQTDGSDDLTVTATKEEQLLPTTVRINHESNQPNQIKSDQIDAFISCSYKYATFGEAFIDAAIAESLNSFVPGKRFLDIGCGIGDWCYTAALLDAKTIDGFDVQEKMVKRAKQATAELDNIYIQVGSVGNMPYSDASFDVATSLYVTCNLSLQTFEKHFQELYRVLVPGGKAILLITTDWCQSRLYTMFGADPTTVENNIAKILSSLPKYPTTLQINEAFKDDIGIYVATFAVDSNGDAFHVNNISQLTECQPIWTYCDGEVFLNYFHSNQSITTSIVSARLHIDNITNHFTEEKRVAYNEKGPSMPMIEKCVKEPLALVYHVSKAKHL